MRESVELREIVDLQRGQSYRGALLDQPGPVLLGLGTIKRNGGFQGQNLRTYGGESPDRTLLEPGDLYVSLKDLTHAADLLGAVAKVPDSVESGRLTQDTMRLDLFSERVSAGYLYWALQTPDYRAYCRTRGTGTTNLDLSRNDFLSYEIRIPSKEEQLAIVELLAALDDKIVANTKLARAAEELAEAEYRRVSRTSESTALVKDIMTLEYGKSLPVPLRTPGTVVVFGSGGVVGTHNQPLRDGPGVVVGRKGTAGAVHWASGPHFPIDTTFYVVPISERSTDIYCYFALRSLRLAEMNSDSAVPGLNRSEAHSAPLSVPSREKIQRFSRTAGPLLEIKSQGSRENQTLAETRDALLPHLISGRLRVKDAEKIVGEAV